MTRGPRLILALVAGMTLTGPAARALPEAEGRGGAPRTGTLWERAMAPRFRMANRLARQAERLIAKRRYAPAIDLLRRALRIRPSSARLHFGLGSVLLKARRFPPCVKHLQRARVLDPRWHRDRLAFRLGVCLAQRGRYAEAIRNYEKALKGRTLDAAAILNNLGASSVKLGKLNDAAKYYKRVIRLRPSYAVPQFGLAVVYERQGRLQAAEQQIRRALQVDPKVRALFGPGLLWRPSYGKEYYRAIIAVGRGRRVEALYRYRSYLHQAKRSPWRVIVRRRLARLAQAGWTRRDLRNTRGIDANGTARALTTRRAALRLCLGKGKTSPIPVTGFSGVTLDVTVDRRGTKAVAMRRQVGRVAPMSSCFKTALRPIRWRKLVTDPKGGSLRLDIVGP